MKLRRGCGCPLLVIGVLDLVFVMAVVLAIVRHSTGYPLAITMFVLMAANCGVCLAVGINAIRGQDLSEGPARTDDSDDDGSDSEGEEPGEDLAQPKE